MLRYRNVKHHTPYLTIPYLILVVKTKQFQPLSYWLYSFYILSVGLIIGVALNIINQNKPETTLWGIIISFISILVMIWLTYTKKRIGVKLDSKPIIADGNCTKICVYMSIVLLVSSLIYELTGFAYADIIGTAGLVYFSFSEGKEAFEKAKSKECNCDNH